MQVLRVLDRQNGDSGRTELPYALRRPQRPAAPQMDALGLARHLAVSDVQVCAPSITHSTEMRVDQSMHGYIEAVLVIAKCGKGNALICESAGAPPQASEQDSSLRDSQPGHPCR